MTPLFAFVRSKYPRLTYRFHFSDDPAGGLLDNVDLAVHFGEKSPPGPWVARELTRDRVWLVASAEYLARRGTPQSIEDLAHHDLLAWECPGEDGRLWPKLSDLSGRSGPFDPAHPPPAAVHARRPGNRARARCNTPDPGVPQGALVSVLPELVGREIGLRDRCRPALSELPRIKALMELLRPFLGDLGL